MTRCHRTDPHLCTLGNHLPSDRPEPPLPLAIAALFLAFAVVLAAGVWR